MTTQTSFLICCLPRSGSWLLAEGLQQTAVAGRPREFFAPESEASWRERWGLPEQAPYGEFVARALQAGSTSNGVFGAKVHWYQFEHLEGRLREAAGDATVGRSDLLQQAFPGLRLIWLRRRDKVRQAVSYYKASRTQRWWDIAGAAGQPGTGDGDSPPDPDAVQFEFDGIEALRHTLMTHEASWARFFRESAVKPLVVEYEELARDYEGGLRRVLGHLDVAGWDSIQPGPTRLRRQADGISDRWVRRFRELQRQRLEQQALASTAPLRIAVCTPAAGVPVADALVAVVNATTCHVARCVWGTDAGSGVTFEGDLGTTASPRSAAAELAEADVLVLCEGHALPDHRPGPDQAVVVLAGDPGPTDGGPDVDAPVVRLDAARAARVAWSTPVTAGGDLAEVDRVMRPVVAAVVAAGVARARTRPGPAARRPDRPRLSVVVVSHDEGVYLRRTVRSVLAGLADDDEVVVVDDRSTDDSLAHVPSIDDRVRVLRPADRQGSARARNVGARAARGDVLVFADAHVEAPRTWVDPLLAPILQGEADAVAPRLNDLRVRGNGVCGGRLAGVEEGLLTWRWLGWQGPRPHPVPLLCGCFMAVRRDAFDAIGGFDDGIFPYGLEDTEISLRLWTRGYRCAVVPEVLVTHRFGMPDQRVRSTYKRDAAAHQYHALRLAFIHFRAERLERFIDRRKELNLFPTAFARVLASDAGEGRRDNERLRTFDDEWFFSTVNAD